MNKITAIFLGLLLLCTAAIAQQTTRTLVREGEGTLPHPTRILLAGDSLMEGLGPQLKKALDGYANLTLIPIGKKSTGLSRPDFYNWPKVLEENMIKHKPHIVVMWVGTNDPQNIYGIKGLGEPLSRAWQLAYRDKLFEIINIVHRHKARLIFMGPPVMDKQPLNEQLFHIARLMSWVSKKRGSEFLNTRRILAGNNGQYLHRATLPNGKVADIRTRDHVHITAEGNILVMDQLLPFLSNNLPGTPLRKRSRYAQHRMGSTGISGSSTPRSPRAFRK